MSSLDDRFIVISKKGEENLILNWIDFEGKTVKEIREKYLSENQNLLITNTLYSELLDNSEKPSELYPQLALAQYPDQYLAPQNCLSIVDNDFDFSIKFQIVCQEKEPKIDFPPLDISFKRSNFLNCEDIFKYVSEKLTFSHFDDKFFQDSVEISPDTSPTTFFENSKKSPIYFHTTFADSAFKKLFYRQNILKEIISTENTYVNDLCALIDYWKPGMKRTNYFTDQEISFFFGDLPDILKLHAKFKKSLEERGTEYSSLVSDIFLKFSTSFSVSKRFISTYAIFTYILNEKAQTNKNSSSILQNLAKMNTFEEDRDFTSYLITPVQRMPRYMLFLRELAKYSPSEHPDFQFLDKAMKSIVSVTQDIDLFSNSSRQIAQIMTNFSKPLFIFKEGRNLIEMATVYVNQSPIPFDPYSTGTLQTTTAPKEGYFYLFNDSVLLTTIDQISSPKSKDSPNEFSKYPENPLFLKDLHHFKYFPHPDSIEFSLRDKRAKKGVNHFLIYFKKRTDCFDYLEKLENQRMGLKAINNEHPWILWHNKFFDLRPKINSKQLNRPIKFTKILPSAHTQGTSSTFSEGSQLFHFFFGGESREKTNSQLVTIKDDRNMSIEIDSIENNSPNIHSRSGHSLCSDGKDIYVFGGKKSNYDFFDDLWKYETETKTWQLLTPRQTKPSKRAFHCCCFYHSPSTNKQTITVFGGLGDKKKPLDDIAVFDIDTCNWTIYELFNSPSPRYSMGSCICNESFLIIVGGRDERYVFNDVYSFDLAHKMWKKIVVNGETVFPRFGHRLVDVGDWVVAVGGASFEEIFVDNNSTRVSDNEKDKNGKKNGYTFSSLPPTAINIKTGKSFNIDEFGNAPQSLIGFGIVKLNTASKSSNDENQNNNENSKVNENDKKENNEANKEDDEAAKNDEQKENNEVSKEDDEANKNDEQKDNEASKKDDEAVKNDDKVNNEDNKSPNIEANNSINEGKKSANNASTETSSNTENKTSTNNNESSIESDCSISKFLVFGGFEDGFNASRNAWFTIDIPNNLTELIEGPKPKPIEPEPQTEKEKENEPQKTPAVQLPINNEVISNTEEIIHVDISKKLNDELEKESILINQQDNENNEQENNEQSKNETQENPEQIVHTEKLENEIEDKKLTQKEEEEKQKQNEKEKVSTIEISEPANQVSVSDQDKDNNVIKKQETEIEEEQQNEKQEEALKVEAKTTEETQNVETKATEETQISQEKVSSPIQQEQKENNKSAETEKQQQTKTEESKQDQEAKKEVTHEDENQDQTISKVIQSEDEQKQQRQNSPDQEDENKDQQIQIHQTETETKADEEKSQEIQNSNDNKEEDKKQILTPKSSETQQTYNSKVNNDKETKQQILTPKSGQTPQIQNSKVNNEKVNDDKETKQQILTPSKNNENETKIKQQIETPKPDNEKENKHFQTPKINQTQQMRNSKEKQQIQAPKTPQTQQNLSQTPKDSQPKEKQIQKQQEQKTIVQKTLNQKQIQTQNRQRKSIEPQKSTTNNAGQKRPIQGQKQNQQRTQKQPPKYQKRQTLEPSQTKAARKTSNINNNNNKKPIKQNKPRRKTTFYEEYIANKTNELKSDTNKQDSKEATKTKTESTTTTKTVTTKTFTKSTTATKAAPKSVATRDSSSWMTKNTATTTKAAPKSVVARDSSSSMTKNTATATKAIRSTASRQQPNQQRKQVQKSHQPPQKETQQQQQHHHAEEGSIFDFKRVIDRKLSSFHSNSALIGSQTQDSQPVFKQPSMSEDDALFVSQLGVDLTNLDLFSRKLVLRRLRHAVEAGADAKTRIKTERLESAFVVSFTASQNENYQEQNSSENFSGNDNANTDEGAGFADYSPSFTEIDVGQSVSLLASRMQALTDKSGRCLYLCGFDVPFDEFKKAVMEKD